MLGGRPRVRKATITVIGLLAGASFIPATGGIGWGQTRTPSQAESLAAWDRIAAVLRHPRCLNCHQLNSPLQGDARRLHIPLVVRGPDGHGASSMRCANCHNEMGNNPTSGAPGAPHWALAPASMLWEGLSVGDLCRMLKNPLLNGNRSPEALIEHMERDRLVGWGWNPGHGREPVPIPHSEFVDLMRVWVAGGVPCPT